MSWWQALILGIVEGLTEYLPVSSTGHLILTAWLLGLGEDPELWSAAFTFNIVIQAGAIAAVLFLYWPRVAQMLAGLAGRDPAGRRLAGYLLLAFLPAAILGPLFDDAIESTLNGPWPVAFALFVGGVWMLAVSAWRKRRAGGESEERGLEDLNARTALIVGLSQCVAMWPGTSRSMMTIVPALLLGFSAAAAAELSFLLGLITLSAATVYKLATGGGEMLTQLGWMPLLVGFSAATLAAALAVRWFVAFLTRRGLAPFAWYRLAVAALLALALAAGWLVVPAG